MQRWMVVFMKVETLLWLSVEGQDWTWILWDTGELIYERAITCEKIWRLAHYVPVLWEQQLLCAIAQEEPANLGARTWNRDEVLLLLDVSRERQHLLCTGLRSSFCCSCCCTAAWLDYIWFSSPERRSDGCWGTRSLKDRWKPRPGLPDLWMFLSLFPLAFL